MQKSHKQEKQALESKISDLESKQGVGITQDEFNDLKANYEAKKIGMGYKAIVSVLELRGLMWHISFFGVLTAFLVRSVSVAIKRHSF